MAWNLSLMNKPLFNFHTAGKGTYKWSTVEKAICLRLAKKTVRNAGFEGVFAQSHGHRFTGSGADRQLLPPEIQRRVDGQIVKSMRRDPAAWRKSQVARVAEDRPWADNLITNLGLDYLAGGTTYWGGLGYCVLGTGTATPAFTDTGLRTEVVRTSNMLTSGTSDDAGTRTRTLSRTFDFPAESSNRNYAELGLSHVATVANNLSTRALIAGGTVTVLIGQQARVVYNITVALGANSVGTPTSSTGWTAGLQGTSAHCTFAGVPSINKGGVEGSVHLSLCTGKTVPAFGTDFTPGTTSNGSYGSLSAYTVGTYKRVRSSVWALAEGVGTWRSLMINTGSGGTSFAWCWVFDNAQTKDNLHTLTITWSMSYGRA